MRATRMEGSYIGRHAGEGGLSALRNAETGGSTYLSSAYALQQLAVRHCQQMTGM